MDQRLTFITLAVEDVSASRAFYEALGWTASESASQGDFVIFDLGGVGLSLYPRAAMASEVAGGPLPGRAAIAHNVAERDDVDAVYALALEAGAARVRDPAEQFWGGYSAMFADPDGHYWEIGWNPHLALESDGSLAPLD
ncbi:VOC family protein [Marinicauda algicola]|uniref:VOC family protein n=2 Tax=Marinicauda algicola TaxID=2029849 RepID=A0A4S2H683_9PROT|nr:VOC family protein [Marinicauda algicola]